MMTVDVAQERLLEGVGRMAAGSRSASTVLGGLGLALAAAVGVRGSPGRPALLDGPCTPLPSELNHAVRTVAAGGHAPDVMGRAREVLLGAGERRAAGGHYTPAHIADGIVQQASAAWPPSGPASVCDPAVGGGALLLAVARALRSRGVPPAEIVGGRLWGSDLDASAVSVAEVTLWLWAAEAGATVVPSCGRLLVGDGLLVSPSAWVDAPPAGFDLVVGNPPFGSQLQTATARSSSRRSRLRERFGGVAGGYVDSAALFLLAGCDLVRRGGTVALVQPQSVMSARGAAPVRQALEERARVVSVWTDGGQVFDAGVDVCALVFEVGGSGEDVRPVRRTRGSTFERHADAEPPASGRTVPTWAPLLAGVARPPVGRVDGSGRLGDVSQATAGFRQHFYGLVGAVEEAGECGDSGDGRGCHPLVTSGLIHPGSCLWGRRPARFAGRRWQAPVVWPDRIHDRNVRRWVSDRFNPKVLVATQTRVIEAFADHEGHTVPSTPVIEVAGPPDRLAHVVAVLLAPPVTAWALHNYGGAALSADAIKLSARQVLDAPLPRHTDLWDTGASLLPNVAAASDESAWRQSLVELGTAMCEAYDAEPDGLVEWWAARLPRFRPSPQANSWEATGLG